MSKLKFIFEYQEYLKNIENSDQDDYIYAEILKRSKFDRLTLVEGLIYTHPVDKSVDILKRRFPYLDIEVGEDHEIYIYELKHKINHYLPIITNLGYFISQISYDSQNWEMGIDNNSYPEAICLEAKYDYEVSIPSILYHTSPLKFKNKILKGGLSPRSGNKLSKHPERIYLTDDLNTAIQFGSYLKNFDNDNEFYQDGYCIYSIDGKGISKLYSDVNFREGGFYTLNNIKPEFIKLIKECVN